MGYGSVTLIRKVNCAAPFVEPTEIETIGSYLEENTHHWIEVDVIIVDNSYNILMKQQQYQIISYKLHDHITSTRSNINKNRNAMNNAVTKIKQESSLDIPFKLSPQIFH